MNSAQEGPNVYAGRDDTLKEKLGVDIMRTTLDGATEVTIPAANPVELRSPTAEP